MEWRLADVVVAELRIRISGESEERIVDNTASLIKERLAGTTAVERRFLEAVADCGVEQPWPTPQDALPVWQQDLWDRHPFDSDLATIWNAD